MHKLRAVLGLAVAMLLVTGFVASAASHSDLSDDSYKRKALRELRDCIDAAREPGYRFIAQIEIGMACRDGRFPKTVSIFQVPRCNASDEPCPRPIAELVGTVEFGCDGEILSSSCASRACRADADCASGSWCRATQDGGKECVPFQGEGGPCEGFVLPWHFERCEPGLTCVFNEPTGDVPGVCTAP
ncbi:MAG: hypothetical protein ETSY2_27425 [Candidatus Entotheonella gemina]|uniref:Uncharacterized protein n=1 Tax=Candidatus Entotheonella gemina TaxID=1429439 RepID=W4M2V7_9BACT|nr:MAG: hypothetical protein ETSY2_27425 [Candidatus Entotheonella gemina]